MSVQTIKGARQKIAQNAYSGYVPFGVDSEYTDMLSGLTLEGQLKLGGDHLTSISTQIDGSTLIEEQYRTSNITSNYYKVRTVISQTSTGTVITTELYWIDSSQTDNLKKTKTITISVNGEITNISEVLS